MTTDPRIAGHSEDKSPASSWAVLPSVRDSLGFPMYLPPADRLVRDPEILLLDVPAPLPTLRPGDVVSVTGVGYGVVASVAWAFSVPADGRWVAPVIAGLGVMYDLLVMGWRLARDAVRRARTRRRHLGTTTLTLHDEGLTCRSFMGTEAGAAWNEIEETRLYVVAADIDSVHLAWRLAGSHDDVDIEIGPGADLHRVNVALLHWGAPGLTVRAALAAATDSDQTTAPRSSGMAAPEHR